jgi:hypothetical protein
MMFIIYMLRYVKTYWALYTEKTKYNHYIGNIVVRCIFCPRISIPAPNQNVIMQIYLSSRPKSCRNILLPPFRNVVWFTSLTIVTYSFDNLGESSQTWNASRVIHQTLCLSDIYEYVTDIIWQSYALLWSRKLIR